MQKVSRARFLKHEILSINAMLSEGIELLLEELKTDETEISKLYKEKCNKLSEYVNELIELKTKEK